VRALDQEVVHVVWQAVEPPAPLPGRDSSVGLSSTRVPDRLCFRGILIRLLTGASWVDIEAILDHQVSDTTLRVDQTGLLARPMSCAPRPQLRLRCRAGPAACRRPRPVRDPTPRHQDPGRQRQPLRLGRWIVEATNTWWSNYGQLRRNTDRRARHRHAALCLAPQSSSST
jgi:hypothetical protein